MRGCTLFRLLSFCRFIGQILTIIIVYGMNICKAERKSDRFTIQGNSKKLLHGIKTYLEQLIKHIIQKALKMSVVPLRKSCRLKNDYMLLILSFSVFLCSYSCCIRFKCKYHDYYYHFVRHKIGKNTQRVVKRFLLSKQLF